MAAKKESDIQAVLVIVVISTVCAGGLALVKAATAERIAQSVAAEERDAVAKVLPVGCEADTGRKLFWSKDKGLVATEAESTQLIYPGFKDGALCGVAVKTRAEKGYSGKIVILAGFKQTETPESLKMHRVFVLEQTETPGLGARVVDGQSEDPEKLDSSDPKKYFCLNFYDKDLKNMTFAVKQTGYDGNDVAAITASTITSKAVTGAVKEAAELVKGGLETMKAEFAKTPGQK